jgi:hypothetical protein
VCSEFCLPDPWEEEREKVVKLDAPRTKHYAGERVAALLRELAGMPA